MSTMHALVPRGMAPEQYERHGVHGFAVCGPAIPLADTYTTNPADATCPKCQEKAVREVVDALGGGAIHYRMPNAARRPAPTGVCGYQRTADAPGRVTNHLPEVDCPACRAIAEA